MLNSLRVTKRISKIAATSVLLGTILAGNLGVGGFSYADGFSDIDNHWAKNYVQELSSKSIIKGYADGSFRPDDSMTREEAVKMIYEYALKNIGKSDNAGQNLKDIEAMFSDIIKERWSYDSIKYLVSEDIVIGYPNGTFQPEREISRAEYAKIMYLTLQKAGIVENIDNIEEQKSKFSDAKRHWAEKYISVMANKNIIKGYLNGEFRPDNNITRAEASSVMALTLNSELDKYTPEENSGIGTGFISASQSKNTSVELEAIIKYRDRSIDGSSTFSARLESESGSHKVDLGIKRSSGDDKFTLSFNEKDLNPRETYRIMIYLDNSDEQLYTQYNMNKNTVLGRVYSSENRVFYKRDATELSQLTIDNLLRKSLEPVGKTLYVWGGGWNQEDTGSGPDAVTMGVSPVWEEFFNRYGSEYNYNNTRYQIRNGLDCSGYVGWTIYNTVNSEDNKDGYVMLADRMARNYSSRGWGSFESMGKVMAYKPGDIMSSATHVYMVLGTAEDGSVVIVHSSPSGVQINGTPSPYGGGTSKAQILAQSYMSKYYPEFTRKFPGMSRDSSYLSGYERMTWNTDGSALLNDPEGLRNMSAEQVLKHLFNE